VVLLEAGDIPDPVSAAPGGAEVVLAVVTARSASCVAGEASTVLYIPRDPFFALIRSSPAIALKMMGALSGWLREFADKLESLSMKSVTSRLAGYLLGLGTYKFIYMVTPTLQVKQKVSAFWSIAAIGMSLSAVLVGGVVAIRNSTVITPSLRRRWRTERGGGMAEPYVVPVPVHVYEEEVERFVGFLEGRLRGAQSGIDMATRMIRVTEALEPRGWVIAFSYVTVNANMTGIYTKNTLTVKQGGDGTYLVKLLCEGNEEGVRATGGLMRRIGLDWGLERAKDVAGG